jgi:hypothetical protein
MKKGGWNMKIRWSKWSEPIGRSQNDVVKYRGAACACCGHPALTVYVYGDKSFAIYDRTPGAEPDLIEKGLARTVQAAQEKAVRLAEAMASGIGVDREEQTP